MSTKKSYADLKAQLDTVIDRIQSDQISIDEAVAAYEEGTKLVEELQAYLKESENKIKKLQKKASKD